jgi:Peroxide stress protein YaaA
MPGSTGRAAAAGRDVAWPLVLVLLPPSETKAPGGDGAPLDLAALTAPELTSVRTELAEALVKLADDVPASRAALGLSPKQDDEIERNAALWTGPTRPALERYTGVLYDALDVGSMTRAQRARAGRRLAVGSALFGLVRGDDPIPAYRLSAGSSLPGLPTLRALWRPALSRPGRRRRTRGGPPQRVLRRARPGAGRGHGRRPQRAAGRQPLGRQPLQQGAQGPGRAAAGPVDRGTHGRRAAEEPAQTGRVARGT